MSQRPVFWIHRSSRFWWGFATMVFLLAVWIGSTLTFKGILLEYWATGATPEPSLRFGVEKGGLRAEWQDWSPSPSLVATGSGWNVEKVWGRGAKLGVELDWSDHSYRIHRHRTFSAFLPLWIPLLLWIPSWLFWMHRADKKEALLFSKAVGNPEEPA